jgi:hypothetical protein
MPRSPCARRAAATLASALAALLWLAPQPAAATFLASEGDSACAACQGLADLQAILEKLLPGNETDLSPLSPGDDQAWAPQHPDRSSRRLYWRLVELDWRSLRHHRVRCTPPPEIPEPATADLLGIGAIGLGILRRRRRRD